MALPPGPSPISTAVLQFSRDLQHTFSKAKTSLGVVAKHTRAGNTGSDPVLPTSFEDTISKQSRNLTSESLISSSTLLAALDGARAPSLPALLDKTEESSAQPEDTEAHGCEALATRGNIRRGSVSSIRQDALHRETQLVSRVSHAACEAEKAGKVNLVMGDDERDDRYIFSVNEERYQNGSTLSSRPSSAECALPTATSATEVGADGPVYSVEQSRVLTTRKKYPHIDQKSTSRWLHFASSTGSSASLVALRRSSTASSSSVLSSSCPRSPPGMFEHAAGTRFPYQRSSLLETVPPFSVGDFQDVSNRQTGGASSVQNFRVLAVTDSRHQSHRKKLSSPLACCSIGSSPCGPPLLSAALLPAHQLQQPQKMESLLHVEGVEKNAFHMTHSEKNTDNSNCSSNLKAGSYTGKCSGANPANSRLAEVENRWFFVDILGDAPRLVEETPSQQDCFSATAAGVGSTVAGHGQQTLTEQPGVDGRSCSALSWEVSGSSHVEEGSSGVLLGPEAGTRKSKGASILASTLLSDCVEECEHGTARRSLSTSEDDTRGATSESEEHAADTPQDQERPQSQQLENVSLELTQPHEAGQMRQGGVSREKLTVQQFERPHEEVDERQYRCNVEEKGGVQIRAAERLNHPFSEGGLVQQTSGKFSSSCSSIAEKAAGGADLSACNSTVVSSTASCRKEQWDQMHQMRSPELLLQLPPPQQSRREPPHSQQLQMLRPQQLGAQEPEPQRQLVGGTGLGTRAALLRAAFRSVERGSGSRGTEGASVGRRRHCMQKAEGTTSFASLEAMVEFVRNSLSLYGTTALEGVTFHVPAEDAESLIAALEETLPYSWRDFRSAAFEALKPLTALVLGRFVLVQLPSLLLELAGGAAAENAAAGAAAAAAEASGFSAVLALAPWLIVFGGCVYAIVRGAQALQASRRAQFIIYEEGQADTLVAQQPQQHLGDLTLPDVSGTVAAEAAPVLLEAPNIALAPAAIATLTPPADSHAAASFPTASTVGVQPPAAETLQLRGAAGRSAAATEASRSAGAEDIHAAAEETLISNFSEGSTGEENHSLLQRSATDEQARAREMGTIDNGHSNSSIRGSSSKNEVNGREGTSSKSSVSIHLLDVNVSRPNSEVRTEDKAILQHMQGDSAENGYASSGSDLQSDCANANSNDSRMRRSSSRSRRLHNSSGTDTFCGKDMKSNTRYEAAQSQNNKECSSGADEDYVVAEPPTTAGTAEEFVAVFQDRHRRLQEEEALQQQLLTCSADWREKNFSFDV